MKDQQEVLQVESDWKLNSWGKQTFTAGLSQVDRYYREVLQPATPENDTDYWGRNLNLDWHHQLALPMVWSTLAAGVNYRQEQGRLRRSVYGDFPERSAHCFGYYADYRFQQAGLPWMPRPVRMFIANSAMRLPARWLRYILLIKPAPV